MSKTNNFRSGLLEDIMYNNTISDMKMFIEFPHLLIPLKDRLIIYNYMILLGKAHKIEKKHRKVMENPCVAEYLSTEAIIAQLLGMDLLKIHHKQELRSITNIMRFESEILKRKIKEIKIGDFLYESSEELKERLINYMDEESINRKIEMRNELSDLYDSVKESGAELYRVGNACYDTGRELCKVIDIRTRKRIG